MDEKGYLYNAETDEELKKLMEKHEQPQATDKELRRRFHDYLRKMKQRRDKFKK